MYLRHALKNPKWVTKRLIYVAKNPRWPIDAFRSWYFYRTHPDLPWFNRHVIPYLSTLLKPEDRGIEWGSGGSTLWFAKRVKHLTSVENDPDWFKTVREKLAGTANVDLRLCETPETYASVVDEFPVESLDFAIVDGGLARDKCAHLAIPRLKRGGVLILDNANWYLQSDAKGPSSRGFGDYSKPDAASWDEFHAKVAPWRHIWTSDGRFSTAIWIKPA